MRNSVLAVLLAVAATVSGQEGVPTVPSGLDLTLHEVIREEHLGGQVWVRYRFIAPQITATDFDRVSADFPALCDGYVLPDLKSNNMAAARVILSYADRPVVFGDSAPGAVQFFEAFDLIDDRCIWEGL